MSALLNSGRSSAWDIDTLTVRFRPIAAIASVAQRSTIPRYNIATGGGISSVFKKVTKLGFLRIAAGLWQAHS